MALSVRYRERYIALVTKLRGDNYEKALLANEPVVLNVANLTAREQQEMQSIENLLPLETLILFRRIATERLCFGECLLILSALLYVLHRIRGRRRRSLRGIL